MKRGSRMCEITAVRMFAALALLVSASTSALAGPPFQTDDPEPIEFRNYEFYMFATSDGTPVETDIFGPALEFNWGALPNVHIRSEEHTSELQSLRHLVCRLLLEKNQRTHQYHFTNEAFWFAQAHQEQIGP